jgi:hypothetical protein
MNLSVDKPSRSTVGISENVSALTACAITPEEIMPVKHDGISAIPPTSQTSAMKVLKDTIDYHLGELKTARENINYVSDRVHQTILVLGHVNKNFLHE